MNFGPLGELQPTPSSAREDGKEGRVRRKAQPSRREQPATPSSGSVTPRGELIRHDKREKLDPAERRQREDTWQTQRHPATDTSPSPSVRSGGEEDHRRHLQPQGLPSTQQQGSGNAARSGQNAGFRIRLLPPCLCPSGGKEQERADGGARPSGSRKTCLRRSKITRRNL